MTVHIVTDSTSDIPRAVLETLPISVVPVYIMLDGQSYQDNVELSREEFYNRLPTADPHPTTAAPSPGQYIKVYEDLADQGATAIFSIHISRSLSAICESAEAAARQFDRIPVTVIDSGNLSLAEGLIVIQAARAAKAGMSVEEVRQLIDKSIENAFAYAKLDTIDYLLRGGRMSSIQHNVVSLLGIKPILKMNNHNSRMEIARTKSKAFERVLNTALENFPKAEVFGITHANETTQTNTLVKELCEAYPDMPEPFVSEVTPALGAHVGPGAVCVNWIRSETDPKSETKGLKKWLS